MGRSTLRLENSSSLLGVVIAAGIAAAGYASVYAVGQYMTEAQRPPISPVMAAIAIGLIVSRLVEIPESWAAGVRFCTTTILRTGIVLLGLRLSLTQAGEIGLYAVPLVVLCVSAALFGVTFLGARLGVRAKLAGLIAVGTSICGCTAIMATAPIIKARPQEVSYALTLVALIGTVALVAYPFLANALFGANATLAGYFLGTAIHDTSQVAGAGLMYQSQYNAPDALNVATVTKLVRNTGMVLIIPLVSAWVDRSETESANQKRPFYLPFFVVAFVAAVIVRSIGDTGSLAFGVLQREYWDLLIGFSGQTAGVLLTMAMAGVGLSTSLSDVKGLGSRPLILGVSAAILVAVVSAAALLASKHWAG